MIYASYVFPVNLSTTTTTTDATTTTTGIHIISVYINTASNIRLNYHHTVTKQNIDLCTMYIN